MAMFLKGKCFDAAKPWDSVLIFMNCVFGIGRRYPRRRHAQNGASQSKSTVPVKDVPLVTVEGEIDRKPLRPTTGRPDPSTSFVSVPIVNLGKYRLVKLTIQTGGRVWFINRPPAGEYVSF
jgi:hypothetical protein